MPGASRRQMSICGAVRRAFGTGLRGRTDSSPEKRRGLDGTLPHCSAPSFHPGLCHIIKLTQNSHKAHYSLTRVWDTVAAMKNRKMDKEKRTRLEIARGVAGVVMLYLIQWLYG